MSVTSALFDGIILRVDDRRRAMRAVHGARFMKVVRTRIREVRRTRAMNPGPNRRGHARSGVRPYTFNGKSFDYVSKS